MGNRVGQGVIWRVWILLLVMHGQSLVAAETGADPQEIAKTMAKDVNSDIRQYMGTRQKLHQNMVDPLLSSAPMTRFDGTPFDAQIGCEVEKKAVEVLIVPDSSGDIEKVILSQDLNDDGSLETSQTLPFHVSGICANGVMSCDKGTWNNCAAYRWNATPTGAVQLANVSTAQLGGCYCINNHCGTNIVMQNLTTILADLSSGVIATMMQKQNQYMPSRFETDGNIGRYYARSMASCETPKAQPTQTAFFDNPGGISNSAFAAASAEPLYELITTSAAAQEVQTNQQSCSVKRHITTTYDSVEGASCQEDTWFAIAKSGKNFDKIGADAWIEAQALCELGDTLTLRFRAWDGGDNNNCNELMGADADGFMHAAIDGNNGVSNGYVMTRPQLVSKSCSYVPVYYNGGCTTSNGECQFNFTFYNGTRHIITEDDFDDFYWAGHYPGACKNVLPAYAQRGKCIDLPGGGSVIYETKKTLSLSFTRPHLTLLPDPATCRIDNEWVDDGCLGYQANSACSLMAEDIDGVTTIANFVETSNTPMPSSLSITDPVCGMSFSRDWWQKSRDYQCNTSNNYTAAIDDATYRAGKIKESVNINTGDYQDTKKIGSTWSTPKSQNPITMPHDTLPSCMQVCKTRRLVDSTDVGALGVESDLRVDRERYEFSYKECGGESLRCPLDPDEELVTGCGCLNEFAEVASMVQVMRYASRDVICTTGVPQEPATPPVPLP